MSRIANVYGDSSGVVTRHSTMFRIGRQQVEMSEVVNIMEGDPVSVAGIYDNGSLRALAVRNDSTRVVTLERVPPQWQWAALTSLGLSASCAACGTLEAVGGAGEEALFFLFPGLVAFVPGFVLWKIYQRKRDRILGAVRLLEGMPADVP